MLKNNLDKLMLIIWKNKSAKELKIDVLTLKGIVKGNTPQRNTLIKLRSNLDKYVCELTDLNVDIADDIQSLLDKE